MRDDFVGKDAADGAEGFLDRAEEACGDVFVAAWGCGRGAVVVVGCLGAGFFG